MLTGALFDSTASAGTNGMVLQTTGSTVQWVATSTLGITAGSTDTGNVPAGTIAAFEDTVCPAGWTEYEPARGRFLRGIDNGAGIDPDGTRAPGNLQDDDFESHTHTLSPDWNNDAIDNTGTGAQASTGGGSGTTAATGGAETRPANVAILYCQATGSAALENGQIVSGLTGQVPFYSADGTLLSATSSLFIATSTNVGIGTTSPWAKLSIQSTAGIPQFVIGSSTATQFLVDESGRVGIGTTSPAHTLAVSGTGYFTSSLNVGTENTNPVGNNIVGFAIDNNGLLSVNRSGGPSGNFGRTSDGLIMNFFSGGSAEGGISISGTTVSYGAFTGAHYATSDEILERGMLVELDGTQIFKHGTSDSEPTYGMRKTTGANSPTVLGSFLALQEPLQPHDPIENPYLVMAVGNGDMWVVQGEEETIEPGDYLISSNLAGHAMKDPETYMVSHIVARAAQKVDWDTIASSTAGGLKRTKISVTFEQFDRNATLSNVFAAMTASTTTFATSTASTTEETEVKQFATAFMSGIFSRMAEWLADAGNGIAEMFVKTLHAENVYAETVTADELCVKKSTGGHICVTGDELETILNGAGLSPTFAPEPTPEPEPEPEQELQEETEDLPDESPEELTEPQEEPELPQEPEVVEEEPELVEDTETTPPAGDTTTETGTGESDE